ncbi:hypothetical protein [Terrimonas pollutisoli]|uniref:hypothetical protein n=1 Tax=Terrimonas pollutisoli TaxID=3034147 RepID=UPI0023ED1064|nr:hypothetical protein [Terrimonas sp. H1YJ31]
MKPVDEFPLKLAKPAQRALINAGITSLHQLAKYSEEEIALLHGIGPNALRQIKQAFKEKGLSFTKKK